MNRRDFIGTLAGALAASRVSDLSNLDRIIKTLPPSATIHIPAGRSFMLDTIWVTNRTERALKPRIAIGKQLIYSDWIIPPKGHFNVGMFTRGGAAEFQGYQLEDDEPVILTGQPGTTVGIGGYLWDVPKTREEKIEPYRYMFWSSI